MSSKTDWDKYRYLIFDLDGTLIDSSSGVIQCTNYALTSMGERPRKPEEIKKYIGYPLDLMFSVFSDASLVKLKQAFHNMSRQVMVEKARPLTGASEILNYLYGRGYVMAVATTKYSQNTHGLVEKFGWSNYFQALVSGDEVDRVKPAPDLVYLALHRLKAEAGNAVLIGDTVNDLEAARQAGLKTIIIRSPFGNDDIVSHEPELILNKISDLRKIL